MGFLKGRENTVRLLTSVGIFGALGGIINGLLCFLRIPPVAEGSGYFDWRIVPAAMCHGSLLAVCSVGFSVLFLKKKELFRWIVIPAVGWISSWISFIPFHLYITKNLQAVVLWPMQLAPQAWYVPFCYFGLVAILAYFFLGICRLLLSKDWRIHVAAGVFSGVVGSLWWWSAWKPWFVSILHGSIWGILVGFSVGRFIRMKGGI
ncbi:MAG: hypothetical protein NC819_04060 [Candidatus Omnitrophica bacterium]|nr:hypothetical protein [Candidatus Omnitrophota bacterium]